MFDKDLAEITAQVVVAALNNGASSKAEDVVNLYQTVHAKVLELADSDAKRFSANRNQFHTAG